MTDTKMQDGEVPTLNMVELDLNDHILVYTDGDERHMTLQDFAQMVNRGDNVDKVLVKYDTAC